MDPCLRCGAEPRADVIKEAVERAGIDASMVDEVFLGNVCSAGMGQAPARQAAIFAGLPNTVPCDYGQQGMRGGLKSVVGCSDNHVWTAKYCHSWWFREYVETFLTTSESREGYRYGHGEMLDGLLKDGLWDASTDITWVCVLRIVRTSMDFPEEQDEYAIESYKRSAAANEAGKFKNEMRGVTVKSRKGDVWLTYVVRARSEFLSHCSPQHVLRCQKYSNTRIL